MNKSERLNDMLQFINNKKTFNLKDLMEKYNISRSTAIRDVQSLELLGMPIYAEQGRNGRYLVLENRILSPIIFTVDEMFAMYFAMLTLEGYKAKPFEYEISNLEEKFKKVIPIQVKENIEKMKELISLEITNHSNFNPYIQDLIQGIMDEKIYQVSYKKNKEKIQLTGQFIKINSKFGQWYAKFYNIDKQRVQTLRCDKILSLKMVKDRMSMRLEYLLSLLGTYHKQENAIHFSIVVNDKGKDLYDKEHYPSMSILREDEHYVISGYYNLSEEDFISDYILRFGQNIISISPNSLKTLIQSKLKVITLHINNIN
ncbi:MULTISPECIES: helix-turn-helix transcriptional regulator [Bacillaceae]|uniref:helix-turn-helix transcriptional regulator n=1 Tax=Bacillaceae TaxID=186817 RepID=UPI002A13588B|nr:WYL domain-containing protein [Cytobacillus sp. IB215316]MDX8363209.1 WYL domain-containing protein [Cytobacillus sp. IB215316]